MKSEVGEKAASKTSFKEEMTEKIDKQTKRKNEISPENNSLEENRLEKSRFKKDKSEEARSEANRYNLSGKMLYVSDLDGTLLNKNGEISPANKQAIKEMAKEGIIPTIATGRMYEASRRFAEQLELDVPIITYNGALIKSVSGKVYFEGFLPPKIVSEIL